MAEEKLSMKSVLKLLSLVAAGGLAGGASAKAMTSDDDLTKHEARDDRRFNAINDRLDAMDEGSRDRDSRILDKLDELRLRIK